MSRNFKNEMKEAEIKLLSAERELTAHLYRIFDGYSGKFLYDYYDGSVEVESKLLKGKPTEKQLNELAKLGFELVFGIGQPAMDFCFRTTAKYDKDSWSESVLFKAYHKVRVLEDRLYLALKEDGWEFYGDLDDINYKQGLILFFNKERERDYTIFKKYGFDYTTIAKEVHLGCTMYDSGGM